MKQASSFELITVLRRRDTHFLHGKDLVCKSSNFLVAPALFEPMSGRFPYKYSKKCEPLDLLPACTIKTDGLLES